MPTILDLPFSDVAGLRAALHATVPVRVLDRRHLVVTWNLGLSGT